MSSKDDYGKPFQYDYNKSFLDDPFDKYYYEHRILDNFDKPFLFDYDKPFLDDSDKPFLFDYDKKFRDDYDKPFQNDYDKPSQDDYPFSFSQKEPNNAINPNDQDNFSFVSSFFQEHHTFNRNSQNNANDLNNQDNLSYHNISNTEKKNIQYNKTMTIDKFKGCELVKNDYTYSTENKELTSQNESKTPKIRFLTRKLKLGGKRTLQTHDKFSRDNMLKKIKIRVINSVLNFINNKIKNEGNLCSILENKPLLRIKTNELKKSNIQYNKDLLKKKIKDILYSFISGKYRNGKKEKDYNKKLIDKIY